MLLVCEITNLKKIKEYFDIFFSEPGDPSSSREEGEDVFRNYATPLNPNKASAFIYKIPNQYHKEETERDGSRSGSFGYVDPFGIRRVIHYGANRTGFQAARDFKFVGKQQE